MSDPAAPAPGASGARLFSLPSVRIALVIDAASVALGVVLFLVTSNLFVFALPVLGAAWLAVTILRARLAMRGANAAAPTDYQIVR